MNPIQKKFNYGDHEVVLETGRIARQATASVLVTMSQTAVLVSVVCSLAFCTDVMNKSSFFWVLFGSDSISIGRLRMQ